jgi:hypothetical protein
LRRQHFFILLWLIFLRNWAFLCISEFKCLHS